MRLKKFFLLNVKLNGKRTIGTGRPFERFTRLRFGGRLDVNPGGGGASDAHWPRLPLHPIGPHDGRRSAHR